MAPYADDIQSPVGTEAIRWEPACAGLPEERLPGQASAQGAVNLRRIRRERYLPAAERSTSEPSWATSVPTPRIRGGQGRRYTARTRSGRVLCLWPCLTTLSRTTRFDLGIPDQFRVDCGYGISIRTSQPFGCRVERRPVGHRRSHRRPADRKHNRPIMTWPAR